jgi:carbon-monoxide dehydrogenase medium subunit
VVASLLDAEMVANGPGGTRVIPAADFFQTVFTTDLRADELLVETRIPLLPASAKVGFVELSRRAGDFALAMVAVAVDMDGEKVQTARIAVGGVSDRPLRASAAERALQGRTLTDESTEEAGEIAADEVETIGDIHGSAEYRRDLVRVLTKRALRQAIAG